MLNCEIKNLTFENNLLNDRIRELEENIDTEVWNVVSPKGRRESNTGRPNLSYGEDFPPLTNKYQALSNTPEDVNNLALKHAGSKDLTKVH